MQNYVISLKKSSQRRTHIEDQFGKQGVKFDFFDALTPEPAIRLANKMFLNIENGILGGRELACFMSHVAIWQKVVDENIPYVAIFEDDVYLGENATYFLNTSDWIHEDWHIIKIEAFAKKLWLSQQQFHIQGSDRCLRYLIGDNLGTAGYILSLTGAKTYLDYVSKNPLTPLDEMMFYKFNRKNKKKVLQMFPSLCIQEMNLYPESQVALSSELIEERKGRMKKFKKKGIHKIQHEIRRIYEHFMKFIYAVENKFK